MKEKRKIILAGGSGFLGETLARWFDPGTSEVVVLSRNPKNVRFTRAVEWDSQTLGPWTRELEGATAVVNLAGRSVNCRYHEKNRKLIMDSRIDSTRVLGEAMRECQQPPAVWLNSSTATIYRHTFGPAHGEAGEIGATPEIKDPFSIEVAKNWEHEFEQATRPLPNTRAITLRTAMVLGAGPGGVYHVLRRLARLGLGGDMGTGRQFVSWIHAEDFCRAIDWLIANPEAAGIYNLTSPHPLPNGETMRTFRKVEDRCVGLPAPAWLLEIGAFLLRTETELILKSRRVIPQRLLAEGFEFRFPTLETALRDLKQSQPEN